MMIGRISRWILVKLDNHRKGGNKLAILEIMTAHIFSSDFEQMMKMEWKRNNA